MGAVRAYAWEVGGTRVALSVSSATDRGHVREINEDSYLAAPPVFLVADGMGGHSFGDRASAATAEAFVALGECTSVSVDDVLTAVQEADRVVQTLGDDQIAGSTLAGIAFVSDADASESRWMTFNVGDSRVYRWGARLEQLSTDHSAVQELLDRGEITAEEARVHPERNVVTRAIGVGDADPEVSLFPAGGHQRFVLCSDGLTKELDDATILGILDHADDLSPADRLVRAALAAGGDDNITVVVLDAVVTSAGSREHADDPSVSARLEDTRPRV